MLSINIRHKGKRTMTLSECQDMAAKLGITAASLPKALWFLHYRVGILLYYPEIEGFSQLIICDVQVIFYYQRECVIIYVGFLQPLSIRSSRVFFRIQFQGGQINFSGNRGGYINKKSQG